jgi:hypothetical protein
LAHDELHIRSHVSNGEGFGETHLLGVGVLDWLATNTSISLRLFAMPKIGPAMTNGPTSGSALPLPPPQISILTHVNNEWQEIIKNWQKGWASDARLANLEFYIEFQRARIFERKEYDQRYDWQTDWLNAKHVHDLNTDFVRNRRSLNEDTKTMWMEWHQRTLKGMMDLSLETLKSMVILNGAAMLASLTVLSGQISSATQGAKIAAKCTMLFAILSITMLAVGHMIIFARSNDVQARVRGVLFGSVRHHKLYAISRYVRRYLDRYAAIGNALIYGSVVVFALGSGIAAIVLICN